MINRKTLKENFEIYKNFDILDLENEIKKYEIRLKKINEEITILKIILFYRKN